jgi:hypothetical protein
MIRKRTQKHARDAMDDYLRGEVFKSQVRILVDEIARDHIKSRIILTFNRESDSPEPTGKTEMKGE